MKNAGRPQHVAPRSDGAPVCLREYEGKLEQTSAVTGAALGGMMRRNSILAALVLIHASTCLAASSVERRSITSAGLNRTYSILIPERAVADGAAGLIVTLHGAGGSGAVFVERWRRIAEKEGLIVVGPDALNSAEWSSPQDGPTFLIDVVEEVRRLHRVDGKRLYLFGHSRGAIFALQMALVESSYFAAVAAHGGVLRSTGLAAKAARKIPISLLVGTQDEYVPLNVARSARDALAKLEFAVRLTELPNQTHDYDRRAVSINEKAWEFFRQYELPSDPQRSSVRTVQ
jgi:predicted esterase